MSTEPTTLVDTSAWIEYLRPGDAEVADRVEALVLADEAAVCDMVLLELWNGARGASEKKKLAELQAHLRCLDICDRVWNLARRLATCCRDAGLTVPATDILIAACASHHRAKLEHNDGHFDKILPLVASCNSAR